MARKARHIKTRLGINKPDLEAALRDAFAMLAHGVDRQLEASGDDAEAAKARLRQLAREWVSLLLGTPSLHPGLFGRKGG